MGSMQIMDRYIRILQPLLDMFCQYLDFMFFVYYYQGYKLFPLSLYTPCLPRTGEYEHHI
jgi:hypothetical protein